MNKAVVGVIALFVLGILTVSSASAENTQDKQCRNIHVLVERSNGGFACLTEKTAERAADRFGWKIITDQSPDDKVPAESTAPKESAPPKESTAPQNKTSNNTTTQTPAKTIPEEANNEKEPSSTTEISQVPNPAGYSIPVVNRDEFAKHFLHAANDKLKPKEDRKTEFDTENGELRIRSDTIFGTGPLSSVTYTSFDGYYNMPEQVEFVTNFMNKMNFKMPGNDIALHESLWDNCESNISPCNRNDDTRIRLQYDKWGERYSFFQEYGNIGFEFKTKAYTSYGSPGLYIDFNGWLNDPNPIFTLDEETALQIALDFALHDEKLNKSHGDGGTCEYVVYERFPEHEKYRPVPEGFDISEYFPEAGTRKTIISDVPYYQVKNGWCTYDPGGTGHMKVYYIVVDGVNGETVYAALVGRW